MAILHPQALVLNRTSDAVQEFDVAETLSQAKRVLRTHRDWMKRRNPSVAPLQGEEEDGLSVVSLKKWSAWSEEEPSKSATEQERELQDEAISAVQREGGGAGGGGSGQRRPRSSKVSPAVSVESPPPPLSTAWLSGPVDGSSLGVSEEGGKAHIDNIPATFKEQKRPQSADSAGQGEASDHAQRSKGIAKKKKVSRNAVAPTDVDFSDDSARRTPIPDVFFSPSASSITSLPEVNRAAWAASTSSLILSREGSRLSLTQDDREEALTDNQLDLPSIQEDDIEEEDSTGKEAAVIEESHDHHLHSTKDSSGNTRNYQEFLSELHSASTGTVIPIAPAPKHRTTSYLRHKHSKVGSECETEDTSESRERLDGDEEDTPPLGRAISKEARPHHSHIPDSTMQPVLPKSRRESGAKVFVTSPRHSPEKSSLNRSRGDEGRTLSRQWTESNADAHKDQKSNGSPAQASSPAETNTNQNRPTPTGTLSSRSKASAIDTPAASAAPTVGDLQLEDIEEENVSCDVPPLPPPRVDAWSTDNTPAELPLQLKDVGEEEISSVSTRELFPHGRKTKLKPIKRHLPSLKSQDSRKSSSAQELPVSSTPPPSPPPPPPPLPTAPQGRRKKERKKEKSKHRDKQQSTDQLHTEVDYTTAVSAAREEQGDLLYQKAEGQQPPQRPPDEHRRFREGGEEGEKPCLMSDVAAASTSAAASEEECTPSETERGSEEIEDIQLPPLLRVRSITSLTLPTDFKFTRKRQREPPSYSIHRPSESTVPVPPCPTYGTVQPSEAELVKSFSQVVSPTKSHYNTKQRPPSSSSSSSPYPRNRLVDEGIQTNPVFEERPVGTNMMMALYDDDSFLEQAQIRGESQMSESTRLFRSVPTLPLEAGPLHLAARAGNLSRIKALLEEGHDVNSLDNGRYTPLMYCILPEGHGVQLHCADLLIRRGANLDHQAEDGSTALHLAAYTGALSLIELLLLNGANPDLRDGDGRLPLHWATRPHSAKPIAELLKYSLAGMDSVDGADMTLLMWASFHQNQAVLRYLLAMGVDVEEKDVEGKTAMHWSIQEKDSRCLELLLLKTDMTYFKDHGGRTVMHTAAGEGSVSAVEFIIGLRPDAIYDTDKKGRTPLHYSAANNKVDVCCQLLSNGADATERDLDGRTALDYAREKQHEYAVALFTCHKTSIADYTRMTRSISNASSLARSTSFSNLAGWKQNEDSISVVSESLSMDQPDIVEEIPPLDFSMKQQELTSADIEALSRGSYLGFFPKNSKDPPLHYYFWVSTEKGTLCWSRSSNRRNKREARVHAVYSTASHHVSARPDFSPDDLHRFTFWLTTETGVLDLLAYTEQAFHHWVKELQALAEQNCAKERDQTSTKGYGSGVEEREEEKEEEEEEGGGWTDSSFVVKRVSPENPHRTTASPEGEPLLSSSATNHLTSTPISSSTGQGAPPPLDPYQVM